MPVSVAVRSPPPPPFTFRNADFDPLVFGLNSTLIAQVALPASDFPQLFVSEYCPAPVPDNAILVIAATFVLVLVTVTDFAVLAVFTA